MRISNALVVALIVLNRAVLGWLVSERIELVKPLQAQRIQTVSEDYVMYASLMDTELGNLWVIDTRTKRMACYRFDRNADKMIHFETRDLRDDLSKGVGRPSDYRGR